MSSNISGSVQSAQGLDPNCSLFNPNITVILDRNPTYDETIIVPQPSVELNQATKDILFQQRSQRPTLEQQELDQLQDTRRHMTTTLYFAHCLSQQSVLHLAIVVINPRLAKTDTLFKEDTTDTNVKLLKAISMLSRKYKIYTQKEYNNMKGTWTERHWQVFLTSCIMARIFGIHCAHFVTSHKVIQNYAAKFLVKTPFQQKTSFYGEFATLS